MIDSRTRKKILKAIRDCRSSTEEDFNRVSKACDGIAITDFESCRKIVKTADVADILGMTRASVRSLVNAGKLKGYRRPGNK